MKDNEITVKVIDSETADSTKIGILSDPDKTYRYGAVGLAARDNEQYEVGPFFICVSNCQDQ
jgi:hypothetical protein